MPSGLLKYSLLYTSLANRSAGRWIFLHLIVISIRHWQPLGIDVSDIAWLCYFQAFKPELHLLPCSQIQYVVRFGPFWPCSITSTPPLTPHHHAFSLHSPDAAKVKPQVRLNFATALKITSLPPSIMKLRLSRYMLWHQKNLVWISTSPFTFLCNLWQLILMFFILKWQNNFSSKSYSYLGIQHTIWHCVDSF